MVVAASFFCNVLVDGIIFSGGLLTKPIREEFQVSQLLKTGPIDILKTGATDSGLCRDCHRVSLSFSMLQSQPTQSPSAIGKYLKELDWLG